MRLLNERRRYIATSSPIGSADTQSDPWMQYTQPSLQVLVGE